MNLHESFFQGSKTLEPVQENCKLEVEAFIDNELLKVEEISCIAADEPKFANNVLTNGNEIPNEKSPPVNEFDISCFNSAGRGLCNPPSYAKLRPPLFNWSNLFSVLYIFDNRTISNMLNGECKISSSLHMLFTCSWQLINIALPLNMDLSCHYCALDWFSFTVQLIENTYELYYSLSVPKQTRKKLFRGDYWLLKYRRSKHLRVDLGDLEPLPLSHLPL